MTITIKPHASNADARLDHFWCVYRDGKYHAWGRTRDHAESIASRLESAAPTFAHVAARIETIVAELWDAAAREAARYLGRDLHFGPAPSIGYFSKSEVGGRACGYRKVEFNSVLLMENLDDFLGQTVPHEVAHCVDDLLDARTRWMKGALRRWDYTRPHGKSWARVMGWFGCPATRCHSYDTSNIQTGRKRFEYACDCRTYHFGVVRHNRSQRDVRAGAKKAYYTCRLCGGGLTYTGNTK